MLITIVTAIVGIVAAGGVGLFALSGLGVGGGLVAWFAAKKIPWKLIGIIALALFIGVNAFAAYHTFKVTQDRLIESQTQLAKEKLQHAAEKARADDYKTKHDQQVQQIDQLEKDRSQIEENYATLRGQLDDMTLQEDFTNDSAKAIAALNSRNRQLNSLLERASKGAAANGGDLHAADRGKARKTRAAAPLQ